MGPVAAGDGADALGKDKGCSDFELRGLQKAAAAYISMQQQQQQKSANKCNKKAEEEGFTRSISLYWHWVRGQKAASKMGKVSCWSAPPTHAPPQPTQQFVATCSLRLPGTKVQSAFMRLETVFDRLHTLAGHTTALHCTPATRASCQMLSQMLFQHNHSVPAHTATCPPSLGPSSTTPTPHASSRPSFAPLPFSSHSSPLLFTA